MIKHEEGFFQSIRHTRIYHQCWLPEGDIKAVLLIVHGLGEHSGRYMNLVNYVIPLGYAVYGLDHVGHGLSEGMRKHIECFEDFTDTLKVYMTHVQQRQPGKPVILVGHSMGELISAFYLLDHQAGLAGAVLSGIIAKAPANTSPVTVAVGKLLSGIAPRLRFLGLEFPALCRDSSVVQAYIDDPLVCCDKATARLAVELLRATQYVQANTSALTLPLLLLQGTADHIVDPAGARMLYEAVSSKDKTLKMYDGFYHELINEPDRAVVLQDIATWLEAHV